MLYICYNSIENCYPPSSSSSSVWELLPICHPFIIQQPPSPCSASINLAFTIQQVKMPPNLRNLYIGESIRPPQAATGRHRPPQGIKLSGFGCFPNPWKSMKINENQCKSMKIQLQAALGIQTSKFLQRTSSFGGLQHRFFLFGARRQRRQPVNYAILRITSVLQYRHRHYSKEISPIVKTSAL